MNLSRSLPSAFLFAVTMVLSAPRAQSAPPEVVAQTPPMGWNSWNYFAEQGRRQGRTRGCRSDRVHGHEGCRLHLRQHRRHVGGRARRDGVLHTNSKFPDMKALADYVHSKGLKIGIYSGPGRRPARDMRAHWGTKSKTRRCMPSGASTT